MDITEINGAPPVVLSKPAWEALCDTLDSLVSKAEREGYAAYTRHQLDEFVEQVRKDNPSL